MKKVGHGMAHIPSEISELFWQLIWDVLVLDLACTEQQVSICAKKIPVVLMIMTLQHI